MFPGLRRVRSSDRLRERSPSAERPLVARAAGPLQRQLSASASDADVPPKDESETKKLSWGTMHAFASVCVAYMPIQLFLQLFALDYYERQGTFLPIAAYFIMLTRGIDVIFSPLMQTLSDITVSKWGRRKPFMVVGCVPCAVSLMMLLFPPFTIVTTYSSSAISLWFGSTFLVFNVLQQLCVTPYEAMASELTKDRLQRRTIFVLTLVYDNLGGLITTSLPLLLASGLSWLPNGDCSSRDTTASCDVLNTRVRFSMIGLLFATVLVLTNFLCAHVVREDRSNMLAENLNPASGFHPAIAGQKQQQPERVRPAAALLAAPAPCPFAAACWG
jgi:Na+/melibiose symporter-like transporter